MGGERFQKGRLFDASSVGDAATDANSSTAASFPFDYHFAAEITGASVTAIVLTILTLPLYPYSKTRLSVVPGHRTVQEGLSMVSQMTM